MILYKDMDLTSLLLRVREQDDEAFSELIVRYRPLLVKVVGKFSNPNVTRDELFSEAAVALHRAAMSYDFDKSAYITFGLYTEICAHRRLCDLCEKSSRDSLKVDRDVDTFSIDSNIEQRLVGKERIEEYMRRARRVLSEYEYQVFLLYIKGETTAEISEALNRDIKSVENAKSRMLKNLREEFSSF